MKKLPLGENTFREIINSDKLYIDKTQDIYQFLKDGNKYFFLSRPRRFGKSLLVSTLKEIFSGNQELFKGLWIYDKIEWNKYPVIHIDFSGMNLLSSEDFKNSFDNYITDLLIENQIEFNPDKDYKEKFQVLIKKLSLKEKVVILIDEYDKPIINFIDKPEITRENRDILKNFYETIKTNDEHLKFTFLTGVSKFSRVSVFSGLNNLRDITLSESFSTLLGYTQNELESYFSETLKILSKKFNLSLENLLKEIKNWYNGYSWDGKNFVYNPFSILYFFTEQQFNNYWFSSGTPTLLLKLIYDFDIDITNLEHYETTSKVFDSFDIDRMDVQSLLFQTGYLTIKEVREFSHDDRDYILSYPNFEVKDSLLENILADYTNKNGSTGIIVKKLVRFLYKNDIENFIEQLQSLFEKIPHVSYEEIMENIDSINTKQLVLTHLSQDAFDNIEKIKHTIAFDGMTINI